MPGAPVPIGGLRRRVDTLERELADLRRRFAMRDKPARVGPQWNLFLAKTVEVSSYPSSPANVFGIQFLTPSFTRTEGEQTPTYGEHSSGAYDVALSLVGYLPEDTIVFVHRARNGQYVIVGTTGMHWIEFELTSALTTSDASTDAEVVSGYGTGVPEAETEITVYNLQTPTGGTYTFAGAIGKHGLALPMGGTSYKIFQLNCP